MNVISIMAHQDDEMRCLGTMLRCKARGDRLGFVTLTDGSKGFVQSPEISREKAAGIRRAEMMQVAEAVGGEYVSLGELDEFLFDTADVRMRLIEAIRYLKANVIFTHFGVDYNQDHVTCHHLVRHCAMQSCLPVLPTKSAVLAKHPAVFLIEPHGPMEFFPTHYVDISAVPAEKGRILGLHVSQDEAFRKLGTGLGEYDQITSRFRGEQVGCGFAEAFAVMQARGAVKGYSVLP